MDALDTIKFLLLFLIFFFGAGYAGYKLFAFVSEYIKNKRRQRIYFGVRICAYKKLSADGKGNECFVLKASGRKDAAFRFFRDIGDEAFLVVRAGIYKRVYVLRNVLSEDICAAALPTPASCESNAGGDNRRNGYGNNFRNHKRKPTLVKRERQINSKSAQEGK